MGGVLVSVEVNFRMKGNSLPLIGTVLTLALATNVAEAQSSKSPIVESSSSSISSPTEIKLSPEGMKILCEYFPLNSRCPGGTAINSGIPSNTTTTPEAKPTKAKTAPESTIVPSDPTSPESGNPEKSNPVPANLKAPGATPPNQVPETSLPQSPAQGN